jgi:hypothetical protein
MGLAAASQEGRPGGTNVSSALEQPLRSFCVSTEGKGQGALEPV